MKMYKIIIKIDFLQKIVTIKKIKKKTEQHRKIQNSNIAHVN